MPLAHAAAHEFNLVRGEEHGTWTVFMPIFKFIRSPISWLIVAEPAEPNEYLPGFLLICSITSAKVLPGKSLRTIISGNHDVILSIGTKLPDS